MLDYSKILLADKWYSSHEAIVKTMARMQNDLDTYKQKEGANEKVINAKQLTINNITSFVDLTEDLLDAQREVLESANAYKALHKKLLTRYQVLEAYAKSKGLDVSLVDYMHIKDYTL